MEKKLLFFFSICTEMKFIHKVYFSSKKKHHYFNISNRKKKKIMFFSLSLFLMELNVLLLFNRPSINILFGNNWILCMDFRQSKIHSALTTFSFSFHFISFLLLLSYDCPYNFTVYCKFHTIIILIASPLTTCMFDWLNIKEIHRFLFLSIFSL